MYAGYEQYWTSILADPKAVLPFTGKVATQGEIDYANFADRTPHVVLSKTLTQVHWTAARIERDLDALQRLKQQPGRAIYVVGGATLVGSLINAGWIDELRLTVHPVVLGRGKALFKNVEQRQRLERIDAQPLKAGLVSLVYALG
jgi:dihydrofolate reductase